MKKPVNILLSVIYIASALILFYVYSWVSPDERMVFEDFSIALIALYIAIKTYMSITQIDKLGKMDGNVLDNKDYVTPIGELVIEFKEKDGPKLSEKLFESARKHLEKGSRTAGDFADSLQYLVDLIVLFPAIFNSQDDKIGNGYGDNLEKITKQVDRQYKKFSKSLSRGNLIQISEVISLFKAVTDYQKQVNNDDFNMNSNLLRVRGSMLNNPVAKTVYHNYLGLVFHKKAINLLRKDGGQLDTLSICGVFKTSNLKLECSEKDEIIEYLEYADEQFDKAIQASKDDIMWSGFINFNKARVLFLLSLLSEADGKSRENWLEVMERAISSRSKLNFFIKEVLGEHNKDTYLSRFFDYQEEYARTVKLNCLVGRLKAGLDKNLDERCTYRGNLLRSNNSQRLFKKITDFGSVASYQEELKKFSEVQCDKT